MIIDRMQLEKDANTVLTNEIIPEIIVPDARPKGECRRCLGVGKVNFPTATEAEQNECSQCKGTGRQPIDPIFFPPIERPLQERFEWWKHKGILKNNDDRYPVYYAVAKQVRPYLICEVGVFYGYSLMAMAKGALAGGSAVVSVNGFDNEQYAPGCLEWVRQGFMEANIGCNVMKVDTQKEAKDSFRPFGIHEIQLSSVDGDHSYESAYHDLICMEDSMVKRPRMDAVHIVDDVGWALNVKSAAKDFAEKYGYDIIDIPTHKGTQILVRK